MLGLFDPDLRVQNWMPSDLSYPCYVQVDVTLVGEGNQICLPKPRAGSTTILVLLARPSRHNDLLVWVWHEQRQHQFCIPWLACSPDFTILPN